jgi:hypothetical protein
MQGNQLVRRLRSSTSFGVLTEQYGIPWDINYEKSE